MPSADLAVAVDIGGTFTDITLADSATGRQWRAKTPSTPADPSEAFLAGVMLALAEAGARPQEIGRVLHGTTVATNLILEGKTARTALVTTAGFRHVLEIGRQDIPRQANLFAWVKPKRPVPPARVLEVRERVGPGGVVLMPLDEASVHDVAAALRRLDVQAVAICLLHSFAYPAHERRVAELLRAALPEVAVTASVDVLPVVREYERSLATIMNAGVMPAVGTYMQPAAAPPDRCRYRRAAAADAVERRRRRCRHDRPGTGADRAVGSRRRRRWCARRGGGGRHRRHRHGRYRRHQCGYLPAARRADRADAARPHRRVAAAAADGGHGDDRRRRRLDRAAVGRRADRRSRQCRRDAGSRVLRHRRRAAHRDRCASGAGPSAGVVAGRPDAARCGAGGARHPRARRRTARAVAARGGARHSGDRRFQHGGRDPRGVGGARA